MNKFYKCPCFWGMIRSLLRAKVWLHLKRKCYLLQYATADYSHYSNIDQHRSGSSVYVYYCYCLHSCGKYSILLNAGIQYLNNPQTVWWIDIFLIRCRYHARSFNHLLMCRYIYFLRFIVEFHVPTHTHNEILWRFRNAGS